MDIEKLAEHTRAAAAKLNVPAYVSTFVDVFTRKLPVPEDFYRVVVACDGRRPVSEVIGPVNCSDEELVREHLSPAIQRAVLDLMTLRTPSTVDPV
jgi:hypothetical protein